MNKILILLSTYNGERYIREQLDSLFNQRGVDITILARDDGSKDGTISILEEYRNITGKVLLIKGENCGACNSFLKLMEEGYKYCNAYDYFAFCDQDDVWLENKLEVATKILSKHEINNKPTLYMSAYQMVDKELNCIKTPIRNPKLSLPSAFASNCATGCTMVFNVNLLAATIGHKINDVIMHDYWTYLVCLVSGGFIYYDTNPYILYRQHESNVIGGKRDSFIKKWSVRLEKIFLSGDRYKSKLANKLLKTKGFIIKSEERLFLEHLSTPKKISSKLYILKNKDFWSSSFDCNIKNFGLLITGKI